MFILIVIVAAMCGAGLYGGYRVGRKVERLHASRTVAQLSAGEQREFDDLLDECRIGVGELVAEEGEFSCRKLSFGGLTFHNRPRLPIGTMLLAKGYSGTCRRCGSPIYIGYEMAERDKKGGGKETFVRQLLSACLVAACGRIERNGAYMDSQLYGDLIESAENMRDFLTRLSERRQERVYAALEAKTSSALSAGKTDG